MVLFGASVLIVFVLQIPESQAIGEGNKYCVGTMKCKYGGNPTKPTSKCEKKEKKVGIPGKPCKEKGSKGYFYGTCLKTLDCKTTKTDEGKAPKKADPKGGVPKKEGGEPKKEGGEMPKLPFDPPPKKEQPPKNEQPCPAKPQLKQGTPECDNETKKIKESKSPMQRLLDWAT